MTVVEPDTVSFELERFELVGDERVEVGGRWYGVRGRRFVRPSLTAPVEGGGRRLLALLDHKPWSASDGTPWVAAFPWSRGLAELTDAELAVAPDIAVCLPAPTPSSKPAPHPPAEDRDELADRRADLVAITPGTDRRARRETSARSRSQNAALRSELEAVKGTLADERAETARLRGELERVPAAELQAASALARRDGALTKLEHVIAERDAALSAREEAVSELDETRRAHRDMVAERDSLVREREGLARAWEDAVRERDGLRGERDRLQAELETSRAELETSQAELVTLRAELEDVVGERDARPTTPEPAIVKRPITVDRQRATPARVQAPADWVTRALAIAALIVFAFVLLMLVISP